MNRIDRLLAIVLELQAKRRQRAQDLAATFETSVRTIYRDIQALCEAGVPVVGLPGQGYALPPGYFLPPLHFTTDEAIMLLLGSDVMAQSFDAAYRAAAHNANRKIAAALPEHLSAEVETLQRSIRFVERESDADTGKLQRLRGAIIKRQTVCFSYNPRFGGDAQPATRTVDPLGLVHANDAWYLVGWDHARRDLRHFRLQRMENVTLLDQTFQRSPDFVIAQRPDDDRPVVIRLLFDAGVAQWVRESNFFYIVAQETTAEGLQVTLHVRHIGEVVPWVLSWGAQVTVLEPEALRQRLRAEVAAMMHKLSS